MHQRRGDVSFLNRRMNIFRTPTANAINEVCEMVACRFTGGSRHSLLREPGLVCIVPVNADIAVRAVKEITDGIGLRILRAKRLLVTGLLSIAGSQTGGWYGRPSVGA